MGDDQNMQNGAQHGQGGGLPPIAVVAPIADPMNIVITKDENGKPVRPDFDAVDDQEQRIKWKQSYLNALNEYIANKKAQIADFERKIREDEESRSHEADAKELENLDAMLAQV